MARRRLGTAATRTLATAGSLAEAVEALARSPYHHGVRTGQSLAEAQRGVAATLLWNLRVLAGWLPAAGAELLRVLAGWFEIANVDERLAAFAEQPAEPPYRLGTLATAWPRLAATGSAGELRAVLAASAWGDPGEATPRAIQLGMRLAWADRVARRVPVARPWAAGAVALLVARERFACHRELPARAGMAAGRLVGREAASALAGLAMAAPAAARWALAEATEPADLWRAELGWWRRVRTDGVRLLASGGLGPDRVVGVVALLAADAWLVRAALELAARGGGGEVFDALA
jgi:hypothetical protein